MRGASEDDIRSALHEITEGKLDQTTEEYLIGMLQEEAPSNAAAAHDLIGPFILDAGLAKDDSESLQFIATGHTPNSRSSSKSIRRSSNSSSRHKQQKH
ncbi:ATP-binding cassette sub-family F member 1, putative [Eimeria praecox]|uniref:ATP-binding cassette sub-family F member 1, putative n=1 Tax=Eimeria praecox TaxID=51316 RepID=U6H4U0_9EIME|nr:ATP-binding cassette sub-family F member 1, putative [Eimeria praecox]